jgi:AAA domain (dynein-related subfamily)
MAGTPIKDCFLGGVQINSGAFYRVTYKLETPRHDGAIWQFTHRGRAGVAYGTIVHHYNSSVVTRAKKKLADGKGEYLSANLQALVEEVKLDLCVGSGADTCHQGSSRYDSNLQKTVFDPVQVVRDITDQNDPRCTTCLGLYNTTLAAEASAAKTAGIESALDAAIARRRAGVVEEAERVVQAAPRPVREAVAVAPVGGDHPLAHRVPDIAIYERYVSRKVAGVLDLDWLEYAASQGENVILEGPTESGKTQFVEAFAAKHHKPLVTINFNGQTDPTTLWGMRTILPDGSVSFLQADTLKVLIHGGVLYLDEYNFALAKSLAVINSATDDRRMVVIPELGYAEFPVSDQCFIIGSCNPGYAGTNELNEATKRRFVVKRWDYDEEVERQLVARLPVLHDIKREIRNVILSGDVETPLGPSKLMRFERHAIDQSLAFATELFLDSFKDIERKAIEDIVKHHENVLENQLQAAKAEDS